MRTKISNETPAGLEVSIHVPSEQRSAFADAANEFWHGNHKEARAILNPLLRQTPDNMPALRLLAKVSEDGNPAPSLRANAGLLIGAFNKHMKKDLLQRAFKLTHLSQAYDKKQQNDAFHQLLARIAIAEHDYEKAEHHLNQALAINPEHKTSLKLLRSLQPKVTVSQPEPREAVSYGTDAEQPITGNGWNELVSNLNARLG